MSRSKISKSAFTLIEIIGVVIIISILYILVISSQSLITSARINNARSATKDAPITQIDGLIAWYESSLDKSFKNNEQYNDSAISSWFDINPSSYDAQKNILQRTSTSAITYKKSGINNMPSLYFSGQSGGNIRLTSFAQGNISSATIFIVFSPINFGNIFFDSYNADTSISYDNNRLYMKASSTGVWTSTAINPASIDIDKSYVIAAYFNRSNSKFYINDALNIVGNSVINPGNNEISGLTIGSANNNTSYFNGLISEIIIYSNIIKKDDRQAIMAYLSNKYSIKVKNIHD